MLVEIGNPVLLDNLMVKQIINFKWETYARYKYHLQLVTVTAWIILFVTLVFTDPLKHPTLHKLLAVIIFLINFHSTQLSCLF